MTKLEIQAIKLLPDDYCVDGFNYCTYSGYVVAFAPTLPPIKFDPDSQQWTPILFQQIQPA